MARSSSSLSVQIPREIFNQIEYTPQKWSLEYQLSASLVDLLKLQMESYLNYTAVQQLATLKQVIAYSSRNLKTKSPLERLTYSHLHSSLKQLVWSLQQIQKYASSSSTSNEINELRKLWNMIALISINRTQFHLVKFVEIPELKPAFFNKLKRQLRHTLYPFTLETREMIAIMSRQAIQREIKRQEFLLSKSVSDQVSLLLSLDALPLEVKGLGLLKGRDQEVTSAELIEAINQNLKINSSILTLLKNCLRREERDLKSKVDQCLQITLQFYAQAQIHLRKAINRFVTNQGPSFQMQNLMTYIHKLLLGTYDNKTKENFDQLLLSTDDSSDNRDSMRPQFSINQGDKSTTQSESERRRRKQYSQEDFRILNTVEQPLEKGTQNEVSRQEQKVKSPEKQSNSISDDISDQKKTTNLGTFQYELKGIEISDSDSKHIAENDELNALLEYFIKVPKKRQDYTKSFKLLETLKKVELISQGKLNQWKFFKLFQFSRLGAQMQIQDFISQSQNYIRTRLLKQSRSALYLQIFADPYTTSYNFSSGIYCLEFQNQEKTEDLYFISMIANKDLSSKEPVQFHVNKMPPDQEKPFFIFYFNNKENNVLFQFRHRFVKSTSEREKDRSKGYWKPYNFLSTMRPALWTPKAKFFTDTSHRARSFVFNYKRRGIMFDFRVSLKRVLDFNK